MSYYTPERLEQFYRPEMESTYPFSQGGEFYVYEHSESGELAFVSMMPGSIAPDTFWMLTGKVQRVPNYANIQDDRGSYWLTLDHCSDTGIAGWNHVAAVEQAVDINGRLDYIDIIRVDVPSPPMDAAEYATFPTEEIREAALEDLFERLRNYSRS